MSKPPLTADELKALLAGVATPSEPPPPIPDEPFECASEADYESCLLPRAALARFGLSETTAITQINRELAVGRIQAVADEAIWGGYPPKKRRYVIVPAWVWMGKFSGIAVDADFWDTGYWATAFPSAGYSIDGSRALTFFGIKFWPGGVPSPVAEIAAPTVEAVPTDSSDKKGGRPAGKYGEPIARVTMRLMALTPDQLALHTAGSVALDLIAEFKKLNLVPPALQNAERDAAGILRAVRN